MSPRPVGVLFWDEGLLMSALAVGAKRRPNRIPNVDWWTKEGAGEA